MNSHTRTMAVCLDDAEAAWATIRTGLMASKGTVDTLLRWQRAKACRDQRLAMQIEDDKTLDELEQIERETRLEARAACEAVGIDWRTLGDVA